MKGICCIFNLAPHYNAPIYSLIDKEIGADFYLGNRVSSSIKLMNYEELTGFRKKLKYIPLIGNFYYQKGVVQLFLKPYKHYIITGEPYCVSTWIILVLLRFTKKKTYLWTHGWYGNETFLKRKIKKLFYGLSDKLLLYGDYSKRIMIDEGFDSNKLTVIYNSLDFNTQSSIYDNLSRTSIYKDHFGNERPVLIYLGRIQNRKKIGLLIDAIEVMNLKGEHYNLVLIGNQIEGNSLQQIVVDKGLSDQVWFYGACYDEFRLGECIYNSDLCVVPGDVGLTVMHSFVYGTPVLTHNNFPKHGPEFEAIIPTVTGDFFIEDSITDLCLKINIWTNISEETREIVRRSCFSVVAEKYNPQTQIKILKSLII